MVAARDQGVSSTCVPRKRKQTKQKQGSSLRDSLCLSKYEKDGENNVFPLLSRLVALIAFFCISKFFCVLHLDNVCMHICSNRLLVRLAPPLCKYKSCLSIDTCMLEVFSFHSPLSSNFRTLCIAIQAAAIIPYRYSLRCCTTTLQ